jgi:nucleoside-diphosphate-sugar epimerase
VREPCDGPWDEAVTADLENDDVPAGAFDGVDVVFHLAARTHAAADLPGRDRAYERLNVGGTARVLDASRRAGVRRFVFFSSVKAMGEGGPDQLDETAEPRPSSPYGRTKRAAEKLVLEGSGAPEPVVLRLTLVYGPGGKGNLASMIEAIRRGAFPPLPKVANRRSMVHVDDVVEASLLAAGSNRSSRMVFLVSDGRAYSTREIYEWICEALGKPIPAWSVPLSGLKALAKVGDVFGRVTGRRWRFDTDSYEKLLGSAYYSNDSIRITLGFEPKWDLKSSLPEIVASMRTG